MPTYQVEEYYLHFKPEQSFTEAQKQAVESLVSDEGWMDFGFEDDYLVVNGLPDEHTGECLEKEIKSLLDEEV